MKNIYFLILLIAVGCATPPPVSDGELSTPQNRIALTMDTTNQLIFGEIGLQLGGNFESLTLDQYVAKLEKLKTKRPVEFRKALEKFERKFLRASADGFVLCIHSSDLDLGLCDDARCSGLEKKASGETGAALEQLSEGLPLSTCPVR